MCANNLFHNILESGTLRIICRQENLWMNHGLNRVCFKHEFFKSRTNKEDMLYKLHIVRVSSIFTSLTANFT